jgi:hypothetical protein
MLGFCPVSAAPLATAPVVQPPQAVQPPTRSFGGALGFGPVSAAPLSAVPTVEPPIAISAAEVVEAASAADITDAVVQPATIVVTIPGGRREQLRPDLVEGVGYAILPELKGEAHGVVAAVSTGAAVLRSLAGEAAGAAGAGGRGNAPLTVKAAARGALGAKGAAVAVLGLEVDGAGSIGVRGKGVGVIGALEAVATGRQDDDEAAAALVWLLAA